MYILKLYFIYKDTFCIKKIKSLKMQEKMQIIVINYFYKT